MVNTFDKKRAFDFITSIIFLVILIVSCIFDLTNIHLLGIIKIKVDNIEDLMNTLFTVQATVGTLGIALISIMSSTIKDTIFGISVTRYIMHIKPSIFKHKNVVLLQLALIVVSYIFLFLGFYNSLTAVFFISIFILSIMTADIFKMFQGKQYLEEEIKEYLLTDLKNNSIKDVLKQLKEEIIAKIKDNKGLKFSNSNLKNNRVQEDILNQLKEEIIGFNYSNNTLYFYKDLDILYELFKNIKGNDDILNIYQTTMGDIFKEISNTSNAEYIYKYLNTLNLIYEDCNKNSKVYLNIWDYIYLQFFESITKLNRKQFDIALTLRSSLYNNLFFINKENGFVQQKNHDLDNWSTRIYFSILRNPPLIWTGKDALCLKKDLYQSLYNKISFNNYKEFKIEKEKVLLSELLNYTIVLADYAEIKILENTVFSYLAYSEEKFLDYYVRIFCYFYYLHKDEIIKSDLKTSIENLLKEQKNAIESFFSKIKTEKLDLSFIENTIEILGPREHYEENEDDVLENTKMKYVIMDDAVYEFIIFLKLYKNDSPETIFNELLSIANDDYLYFYNYFTGKKIDKTRQSYNSFLTFFNLDIVEDDINEKMDLFENAMIQIYKVKEIEKRKEKRKNINFDGITENIKARTLTILNEATASFNNKYQNISTQMIDLKYLSDDTLLAEKYHENRILQFIKTDFINVLIVNIRDHLKIEKVLKKDKNKLNVFFDNLKNSKVSPDTLMGYYNIFYYEDRTDDFRSFEKGKNKIACASQFAIAIDSQKFYLKILSLDLKKEKAYLEDYKNLRKDDSGRFLFEVNGKYLPFGEEELEKYILENKCKIHGEIEIEYGFNDDIIGAGIFIEDMTEALIIEEQTL
ncbi:MAG: hypothetical protein Q8865_03625 [Bacillota bacterium]|nr:hypothetical protein [Bacillota bacterium]